MSKTLEGACLCGGVAYTVRDPEGMGVCHCTRCQRWTGSSLAAVLVDPSNFEAGLMRELDLKPTFHMMVANKAPWETIGDDAPQFPDAPPV